VPQGEPRPLKFATPLTDGEKSWIVDRINEFLGVQAEDGDNPTSGLMPEVVMPETCTECGGALEQGDSEEIICPACGHVNQGRTQLVRTGPSDTQPATGEFPADHVTIVDQSPERLEFSMRVFENSKMRRGAGLVFGMVALFWNSFVATFVWAIFFGAQFNPGSLIMLVFLLPFLAVGLALAAVTVFILFGRLRVVLDRDELRASWGAGRLRYSKAFTTEAITHVTVENSPLAVKNASRGRSRPETDTRVALVWAGENWIPVTMLQGVNDSRHVAELVRRQLADLGMRVEDRRAPPVVVEDVDEDEDEEDDDELSDVEDETS
jgi:hypothetical protein